ncbi:archaea-specific SMC-related protein [Halorubrum miltondacostae]|uniref:Archaea-specific SMC-related protein n=1 Tax=Halorubrum miltondacostae TaxID=3076378 RepID=A0ABD5M4A4_9EURY
MLELEVSNIGGIEKETFEISPGVTLVTGPNASNKTSLLKAFAFALGAESAPLRSGSTEGWVGLSNGDIDVHRQVTHVNGETKVSGQSLLETTEGPSGDPSSLATFINLLEFNPFRTAIRHGDPIESLLMGPLDIEDLEAERAKLIESKKNLDSKISDLDGSRAELERVQEKRESINAELDELHEQLSDLRSRRDSAEEQDELSEYHQKQADLNAERAQLSSDIQDITDSIDRLEEQRQAAVEDVDEAQQEAEVYDPDEIRRNRRELHERLDTANERIETLQTAVTANREMLDLDIDWAGSHEHSISADRIRCWACGSMADRNRFEATIEEILDSIADERGKRDELKPQLDELDEDLEAYNNAQSRAADSKDRVRELKKRIEQRQNSLQTKRELLADVNEELADVQQQIDEVRETHNGQSDKFDDEIEQTQKKVLSKQSELTRLDSVLSDVRADIKKCDELTQQREDLRGRIQSLTDEIEQAEQRLRESFNTTVADLIERLEFDSFERIWLDGSFEIVVAREIEGTIHRSPIAHLSEGERELVGLVCGLAGYLTYDLDEAIPVLLLDSLGAFDIERLEPLISYFSDRTEYLLVAVYPEIAEQIPYTTHELGPSASVN